MSQGVEPSVVLAHTRFAQPEQPKVLRDSHKPNRFKPTPAEIWERRTAMARLFSQGMFMRAIAEKMGVSVGQVSKEINAVVEAYKAEALKSVSEKIAKEDALIYMVQLEATDAWYMSQEGKIVNNKKKVREIRRAFNASATRAGGRRYKASAEDYGRNKVNARVRDDLDELFGVPVGQEDEGPGEADQVIDKSDEYERTESSPGDPRFLSIILECSDRRARLHGLYPKQDFAGGIGGQGGEDDLGELTPASVMSRLSSLLDKARIERARKLALAESNGNGGEAIPVEARTINVTPSPPKVVIVQPTVMPTATNVEAEDVGETVEDVEALWDASR
jgi:transposase